MYRDTTEPSGPRNHSKEIAASPYALAGLCIIKQPIDDLHRLAPGKELLVKNGFNLSTFSASYPFSWRISGMYGIQLTAPRTNTQQNAFPDKVVVGQLGFGIEEDRAIISHSPQGMSRAMLQYWEYNYAHDEVSDALREQARVDNAGFDFRDRLLFALFALQDKLRSAGVTKIVGIGAENHPNVLAGKLDPIRARKIMDDFYLKHGFEPSQAVRIHGLQPLPITIFTRMIQ